MMHDNESRRVGYLFIDHRHPVEQLTYQGLCSSSTRTATPVYQGYVKVLYNSSTINSYLKYHIVAELYNSSTLYNSFDTTVSISKWYRINRRKHEISQRTFLECSKHVQRKYNSSTVVLTVENRTVQSLIHSTDSVLVRKI